MPWVLNTMVPRTTVVSISIYSVLIVIMCYPSSLGAVLDCSRNVRRREKSCLFVLIVHFLYADGWVGGWVFDVPIVNIPKKTRCPKDLPEEVRPAGAPWRHPQTSSTIRHHTRKTIAFAYERYTCGSTVNPDMCFLLSQQSNLGRR